MSPFAFVFPGQGSQSLGMLDAWADQRCVRDTLEQANQAMGMDLGKLVAQGPIEELNQTAITQPAMLMADIAIWRAWCEAGGPMPSVLAGHSLGEYAALVAAQSLDFETAIELVHQRGLWMQQAVPQEQGAMAAVVGLDDDSVIDLCEEHAGDEVLQAVNFNAPGQVVVAGHRTAVERLIAVAKQAGARMVKELPISVPAHSRLMQPVANQLAVALASSHLSPPKIPVLHNVDARIRADAGDLAQVLADQVQQPVRWVDSLNAMATRYNIRHGFECGPGQVLCGLAKRTLKSVPFSPLLSPEAMQKVLQEMEVSEWI